ncbi:alpha/beta hydrolase [Inhella crocodyli]|uniref:Alpha/beta hydrolase n=1 Tax=Inhella crocodyli TaxID=2499851 RepID=A0A3S2WNA8_9BURK|nr:alpha/beta hydrolase [Inhella crocodyli]RVT83853.1 alpha/beta hydrolase [Inhella crocodyli]
MTPRSFIASTLLALGAAWGFSAVAAPRIESVAPCFITPPATPKVDLRADCGYVVVPENRAAPTGRQVKLGYLRLRARQPGSEPPLFMLSGGPGGSLITPALFSLFQPHLLGPVLDRRDVVVLDQRGTQHTVPHLQCPEFHGLAWAAYQQGLPAPARAAVERRKLDACVAGWRAQGIDLAQYNSVALAADVNDARAALGYERLFYYGASYGSQLGQHLMRDFPGILAGVVLDGTSALSRKSWVEDRAIDLEFSLRQLDRLCRDDPKCAAAYDVPALLQRGLALFDAGPIEAAFVDPKAPDQRYPLTVTALDFANLVYEKVGYKIGVFSLPFFLDYLAQGGRESMGQGLAQWRGEKLLAARQPAEGALATAMYMAVVCSDDPVRSPDEVIREGAGPLPLLFADAVARELIGMCEAVAVPSLPDTTDRNVASALPTLVLSGRLDAQTPTFRSEEVVRTLPKAQLAVFPDGTHVQVGAINACAMGLIVQFLNAPAQPVDTACLRAHTLPGFILPNSTLSR